MKRRGFLTKMLGAVGAAVSLPVLGRGEQAPRGRRMGGVGAWTVDNRLIEQMEQRGAQLKADMEHVVLNKEDPADLTDIIYNISPAETPFAAHVSGRTEVFETEFGIVELTRPWRSRV